ncbi:MAG: hypothetical protein OXU76_05735 [Alphaproteobacteria bacterium]|nr:hypothetical protein [Alphaproteobacteria bacterium]
MTNTQLKNKLIILTLFLLTGCAGIQTDAYYSRVSPEVIKVKFEGKTFLVRDDLGRSAAFLTESYGVDMAKAFFEGLTLTLVDLTAPVLLFEGAMQNYLDEYKVVDCSIIRSNFISDGLGGGLGYEMFYKCE